MKAIAVLNWKNLSVAQEISKASSAVVAMEGNIHFETPNPTLETIGDAIGQLQDAQQQVDANGGGKVFTSVRDTNRELLKALMSQLVAYVNNIANGEAVIVMSAALDSEVKVNWGTVEGAATYHVQMSNDVSPLAWQEFAGNLVTDTKAEVSDLPSGDKYGSGLLP